MKQTKRFPQWMTLVAAALALTATAAVAHDGDKNGNNNNNNAEVRLRVKLMGPAIQNVTPEGSVDFRLDDKSRTRFRVEVEHVNLPAATILTVAIVHNGASTSVGTITLSSTGFGELELESQNGAMVPAISPGDTVTVSNGATAVLTGIFASV